MADQNQPVDLKSKSLFARLKRLFSTDVIVRNVGGKMLKIKDTDQVQYATDRNTLRDRFNRVRTSGYSQYSRDFTLAYQQSRIELFRDYDTMDMDSILSSALNIYADECSTKNEMGQILNIKSSDDNIKKILHNLFYDILNIEFNLWSWTRNMVKYGDFYLKLHISPEYGVYMVEPLSSYNVTRVENSDPLNKNYTKFQMSFESGVMEELESYQVAHFRLLSDSNFLPYGKSILEGARRTWKQLSLLEDAMLIHRIIRAPERRIFKIDIGNIPPNEVDTFMEKQIAKMKKVPYMDEATGEYNLKFNLMNMLDDIYLPVRGTDSGTSIDTLSGMEFTGIDDIEYIRNKMMAALSIPKAFLTYEEELSGKATLAAEDIRFAKSVGRIQRIIVSELTKIAVVHLYSQGYKDDSLVDFELELTNPSTIFEKEKVALWGDKVTVAKDMLESKLFSNNWVYQNMFNMSKDDMETVTNEVVNDVKNAYRLKQIEEEGNDPVLSFQKVNSEGELEDMPGGPDGGGGDHKGDEEPPMEEPPGGGGEEPPAPSGGGKPGGELGQKPMGDKPLKEKAERPSQAGEKDAHDYPFGEDPLGNLENNREVRKKNLITHKFKHNSPLGYESVGTFGLSKLGDFLKSNVKKELISENTSKSMLDEDNIIGNS